MLDIMVSVSSKYRFYKEGSSFLCSRVLFSLEHVNSLVGGLRGEPITMPSTWDRNSEWLVRVRVI